VWYDLQTAHRAVLGSLSDGKGGVGVGRCTRLQYRALIPGLRLAVDLDSEDHESFAGGFE
jgi:hypothetical protein